jgi:hypothetical protein
VPHILDLDRGHLDHAPHLLAAVMPDQQLQQLGDIQPIRLRRATTPVHFDARRVDNHVLDSVPGQEAMEPEAIQAGFVTTADRTDRR